jgi:hypothetical protein
MLVVVAPAVLPDDTCFTYGCAMYSCDATDADATDDRFSEIVLESLNVLLLVFVILVRSRDHCSLPEHSRNHQVSSIAPNAYAKAQTIRMFKSGRFYFKLERGQPQVFCLWAGWFTFLFYRESERGPEGL